jgi:PAS domain S-box-containing protein
MNRLRAFAAYWLNSENMPAGRQLVTIVGLLSADFLLRLLLGLRVSTTTGGVATTLARFLAVLPAVVIAWLFGARAGLIVGILSFPLNSLILNLTGEATGWDAPLQTPANAVGSVMLILIGVLLGRMSDLEKRARRELQQRIEAEAALRQSQAQLETVVANTPIVLFSLDNEGVFTLLEGNGVARLGLQPEQMIGRSALAVYADNPEIVMQINRALAGEQTLWMMEANDLTFEILTNPVLDEDGRVSGVIGVAVDITEQKLAEQAIVKARDAALESSEFKSKLLANVSHELHTPLGAIIGYAEMLQEGIYGPVSEEQSDKLDAIIDSSEQLTGLVRELLDQARLEAGRLQLNFAPFSPAEMVETVRRQMIVLAQAKGVALTGEVAADVPVTLQGDARRIQQVLINLVGNAIKFTEEGSVRMKVYRPDMEHWALQVSDTGAGIPDEAKAAIFEPFRQLEGATRPSRAGFGLGLSIVSQLAALMGGQISLESESGQGSVFTVYFPLEPAYKGNGQVA